MKVLHVITGLGRGGAENMLVRLLAASRGSHAVASMTGRGVHADAIEALGVPVYDLGMRLGLPDPRGLFRLRRIVREISPDVIHGWMYHGALLALLANQKRPVVAAIHHSLADIKSEKLMTRQVIKALAMLSRHAAQVVYCSQAGRRQHEAVGYPAKYAQVIPNGFDVSELQPDPGLRLELRRKLDIAPNQFVVLHAARFHPMKDHANFLSAAQRLWEDERFTFVLAGTNVTAENPGLAPLLAQAPKDRVKPLGERRDVRNLMCAADTFCVSSAWGEAFPLVLGEAMACGVPCVTTDVGDAAHIVQDTGIVVPPRDPEALASAIRQLAGLSKTEFAALATRARGRIVENFSLERIVAAYHDVYETAVRAARRRCDAA